MKRDSSRPFRTIIGTSVLALAALLALAAALWFLLTASQRQALQSRELATKGLAQYLAAEFPGAKALIVANPFAQEKGQRREIYSFDAAGIRGLKTGFADKIQVLSVVVPPLRPEYHQNPASLYVDPKTTTPLSFLIPENSFDQLLSQHPQADLLVSLIGVPLDLRASKSWRNPKIRLALLLPDLRLLGDRDTLSAAVASRKIAAIILPKPGAPPETEPPTDTPAAEFEKRYLLLTPKTLHYLK